MPIYKCTNESCSLYETTMIENNVTLYYDKGESKVIDSGCKCPSCKANREQIREPGFTTYMSGGANVCKK